MPNLRYIHDRYFTAFFKINSLFKKAYGDRVSFAASVGFRVILVAPKMRLNFAPDPRKIKHGLIKLDLK